MKNFQRIIGIIGIIALAAVIGFALAACSDGSDSGDPTTPPGTTKGNNGVTTPSNFTVTNLATWKDAVDKITNGSNDKTYTINVTDFVTGLTAGSSRTFGDATGLDITLTGTAGSRLTGGRAIGGSDGVIRIGADQKLTIDGVDISGDNEASVVVVAGGELVLNDGKILNGKFYGVYVTNTTGKFTMNGGTISSIGYQQTATGAVGVNSGTTFTMTGGTIGPNNARGVSVYGTFNMEGGDIEQNNAQSENGAGVNVYNGGVFAMTGGTATNGGNPIVATVPGGEDNTVVGKPAP